MKIIAKSLATMCLVALAACSGGGGGSSVVPKTATPNVPGTPVISAKGAGTVVASGTVSTGLTSLKTKLRKLSSLRDTKALAISSVTISGTIYPSYGGSQTVSNTQTVTPVNNQIAINLTFTNVPVANNAWMGLHLLANAADGSQFDLGWLASLVNVGANSTSAVNVGPASTQVYQVFMSLLQQRLFSSIDLADPAFATTLATRIAAAGQTSDPTVQLYTPAQLDTIGAALQPLYERSVTVNSGQTGPNATISIVADYTNPAEIALATEINNANCYSSNCSLPSFPVSNQYFTPNAAPTNVQSTTTVGPNLANNAVPTNIYYYTQPAAQATVTNLYSGPVMIGAYSGASPYTGGWTTLAGGIAAGNPTVTVANASVETTVTVNDPQVFAFPSSYGCSSGGSRCQYSVGLKAFAFSGFTYTNLRSSGNNIGNLAPYTSTPFDATTHTVAIPTWSYANLPASANAFCTGAQTDTACTSLATLGTTIDVQRDFHDYGTNFSYYNWQAGPGIAVGGTSGGIVVTTNGASSGTFSTTTATYLGRLSSSPYIYFYPGASNGGPAYNLNSAAIWSVKATDANGTVYTGTTGTPASSYFLLPISGLTKTTRITKLEFTYTMPNGVAPPTAFGISQLVEYLQGGGGCGGGC